MALRELLSIALPQVIEMTEEIAETLARDAILIGYAIDEAYGIDSLPRREGEV